MNKAILFEYGFKIGRPETVLKGQKIRHRRDEVLLGPAIGRTA